MVVKHVNPLSVAKVLGILYALLGLIGGAIFALIATIGGAFIPSDVDGGSGLFGAMFGVGAIVFLPIFYGLLGAIGGLIGAALYNVVAGMVGGIEIDLQ